MSAVAEVFDLAEREAAHRVGWLTVPQVREARAAVAELVAADRAYDKAVFALANCEHHELTFRRRDRAAAEQRRDAALAKFGGGA